MIDPVSTIIDVGYKVFERIFPDKKSQDAAKLKLLDLKQTGDLQRMASQANVIMSEAKSDSWLAANWRPLAMVTFILIIANNHLIAPYMHAYGFISVSVPIPGRMWSLLELGLGGYVVGRSAEKIVGTWKAK